MTREIKFRAWDGKEMIPVTNLILLVGETIAYGNFPFETWKQTRIIKNNLMQYTGLKDKNGKEIYEGDILNRWYHNKVINEIQDTGTVVWVLSGLYFQDGKDESISSICNNEYLEWEVIGNIYENPELLKNS